MADGPWLERKLNWVAVSDDLPPVGRSVIAATASGRTGEAYLKQKSVWRWANGEIVHSVTHWMDMPIAPATFELNRVAELLTK